MKYPIQISFPYLALETISSVQNQLKYWLIKKIKIQGRLPRRSILARTPLLDAATNFTMLLISLCHNLSVTLLRAKSLGKGNIQLVDASSPTSSHSFPRGGDRILPPLASLVGIALLFAFKTHTFEDL